MCYNKEYKDRKNLIGINQMWGCNMNKKAFTLVELLVTIVIIGLIALMGFPSLQRMLNDNATKEIEIYGRSMISAAKMYMQKKEET